MGLLPRMGAPTPAAGEYANPGSPTKGVGKAVKFGDQLRGTFIDLPVLVIATGLLYNMAFIKGNEEKSWGFGDVLFVVIAAWLLKRTGVASRWQGVF